MVASRYNLGLQYINYVLGLELLSYLDPCMQMTSLDSNQNFFIYDVDSKHKKAQKAKSKNCNIKTVKEV